MYHIESELNSHFSSIQIPCNTNPNYNIICCNGFGQNLVRNHIVRPTNKWITSWFENNHTQVADKTLPVYLLNALIPNTHILKKYLYLRTDCKSHHKWLRFFFFWSISILMTIDNGFECRICCPMNEERGVIIYVTSTVFCIAWQ